MRVVRTISWIVTFVAIGAAAAAWFTPQPDVDAELAGDVALRALEEAGIDDATVSGTPTETTHTSPSTETTTTTTTTAKTTTSTPTSGPEGSAAPKTTAATTTTVPAPVGDEIDVWSVTVELRGDEIEMLVDAEEGQLVYVDDLVGENNDERALTEAEWEKVKFFSDDVRRDDWVMRNIAGSIAAAIIVAVGFVLARRSASFG